MFLFFQFYFVTFASSFLMNLLVKHYPRILSKYVIEEEIAKVYQLNSELVKQLYNWISFDVQ